MFDTDAPPTVVESVHPQSTEFSAAERTTSDYLACHKQTRRKKSLLDDKECDKLRNINTSCSDSPSGVLRVYYVGTPKWPTARFATSHAHALLWRTVVFAIPVNTIQFNVVLREFNKCAFPVYCI